jgi:hypothetical protein
MGQHLRLARLFFVLLALVAAGRWILGFKQVPYAGGTHIFSIVTLTIFGAVFYGAFVRRWMGYSILQAALLGAILGLAAQIVILLSTVVSYGLGLETYFTFPRALNVDTPIAFTEALTRRLGGLFFNTLTAGITGAIGWAFGGLLPER